MKHRTLLHIHTPTEIRQVIVPQAQARFSLAEILRRHDLPLNTRCGERGLCDGCLVELLAGHLAPLSPSAPPLSDPQSLAPDSQPQPLRACEYAPAGADISLRIPARSMLAHRPQVVGDFDLRIPYAQDPLVPAGSAGSDLGAAIDVGTTTVVVLLVNLSDGRILARTSAFNRQMYLGDDVLTRINLCMTDSSMLARMQETIALQTILPLLDEALAIVSAGREQVRCLTIAGNTTMLHLLAGVDPSSMGVSPFTPTFLEHRRLSATDLKLPLDAQAHLLPGAAAYVGADLCAGAVASGLKYDQGPSLLVDVGTNGEILLKSGSTFLGCATAAGPAFEGAGLSCGLRAVDGAVSHCRFLSSPSDPCALQIQTIGQERGVQPQGICGSAYVDFLAQARQVGLLSPAGRFEENLHPDLTQRLVPVDGYGRAFVLVQGQGKRDIVVAETDVARLLQAKAAIAAGIRILLARAAVTPAQVSRLYLAGGFGMHMDLDSAISCGLLPGFTRAQVVLVGNSSLGGAYLALVDRGVLAEIASVGQDLHIVELNLDPEFESTYIDELFLPDPSTSTPS
ncbi:MAG: DUF4445 domain-containing protein [Phycisphaeraceae bacterium]|nr:DUF4445 domain-containing protein [Phycisphaeraceae bacterium]